MDKYIAHSVLAAVVTGFWNKRDWQAWADRLIILLNKPGVWLLNLSTASDKEDVCAALMDQLRVEELKKGGRIYIGDTRLGFQLLRFERGDYTLAEFLNVAGDEADGGTTTLGCEKLYDLLNRLEAGGDATQIANEAKEMVSEYARKAIGELEFIEKYEG